MSAADSRTNGKRPHRPRPRLSLVLVLFLAAATISPAIASIGTTKAPLQNISLPRRVPNEGATTGNIWVATSEMFDSSGELLNDPNVLPSDWMREGVIAPALGDYYNRIRSGQTPDTCFQIRAIGSHDSDAL